VFGGVQEKLCGSNFAAFSEALKRGISSLLDEGL
jgi:hypothetical protein